MTDSNATTTRNVLYNFPDSPGKTVTAKLVTYLAVNGNEIFIVKSYPKELDAVNGTATHTLPVPTSGAWTYYWQLPDGNTPKATLSAGSDIQLSAVLSAALSTETPNDLLDTFALKAGIAAAADGEILQSDGDNAEGSGYLSSTSLRKHNFTATAAPAVTDDSDSGYEPGSHWVDVSNDKEYVCLDATVGAAVWTETTGAGAGGGLANVVEDTTPQLGGDLDAQGNDITDMGDITFKTGASGGVIRTGTANADKFILAAYDVNDGVYRTVIELDAGNDVVMQLIADYLAMEDAADTTKHVEFDISGATTGTATTLVFLQTGNQNITFPNETGTLLTDQAIGSTVQAQDAELSAIAALTSSADKIIYFTGAGTAALNSITNFIRSFMENSISSSAARSELGLEIGLNVQAQSAKLSAIDALTWAANSIIMLTGTATAAVQALASHVVTFLQSASAADARSAIDAAALGTANTFTAVQTINMASNVTQAIVKANATQTADLVQWQNSSGTPISGIGGDGLEIFTRRFVALRNSSGVNKWTFNYNPPNDGLTFTEVGVADFRIFLKAGGNVGFGTSSPQGRIHSYDGNGSVLHKSFASVNATPQTVIANGTGDVTAVLSGTFTIQDSAGNVAGGVITATAPSGTFNLYDDGGTNTCQLQVAADGSVTVVRTAGSRTYTCNLQLNWI